MQLNWHFDTAEIQAVQKVVQERLDMGRKIVTYRQDNNVSGEPPDVTKEKMWFTVIMCMLTTQQRSGPGQPVDRFLSQSPFPLSLAACQQSDNVETLAYESLTAIGGIRFTNKIPNWLAQNFKILEIKNSWQPLLQWKDRLYAQRQTIPDPSHLDAEIQAAQFAAGLLKGFGSKQSRNFWTSLGLMRYSFILDSRVVSWLKSRLKVVPGLFASEALSSENYYLFISSILFDLCNQANVLPCMFDAAVFDSFDTEEWDSETPW